MRKLIIILILAAGILCGAIVGGFFALIHDLPPIRSLESFQPSAITRINSADGVLLAELFAERRQPVPLGVIPVALKQGLLITEDRNFYHHSGIDFKGILRAIVKDIRAGRFVEGASTITQQLTKTLFLTPRKTLRRKLREAFLALQLERRYTKNEILELYLNQIYLGSGAYGVEMAARRYFGKSVKALDLAQCALIAGLPRAPTRYSPLVNPELAVKRRNLVLKQMHEAGLITTAQYRRAAAQPLQLAPPHDSRRRAPWFVDYVRRRLEKQLGSDLLYKGGLTVTTTLSFALQQTAEKALSHGLEALEKRMRAHHITAVPQGALVALDVHNGAILAMAGGSDYEQSGFNRAVDARRQPGSAFKPIVFAAAIAQGFSQNRLILDAPVAFPGAGGRQWRPENFSRNYLGEITLRRALALSRNIPAVRLLDTLGPAAVVSFAHRLGISSPLKPNLSLALGTSEVSLLELTGAYAVFANAGRAVPPFAVQEVVGPDGRVVWRPEQKIYTAMSRSAAAIMCDMLQSVIQEGTGRKARVIKRPVAGKTGTTNDYRDALFVGFSPGLAAGVWVGRDIPGTLGRGETGARAALPVWIEFMGPALAHRPYEEFDVPDDTVQAFMDPVSGRRAIAGARGAVKALFRKGSEPHTTR
jgi:penicillin-binding protein 1A